MFGDWKAKTFLSCVWFLLLPQMLFSICPCVWHCTRPLQDARREKHMAVVALKAEAKGKATTKKKETGLGDEPLQLAMLRGPTAEDNPRMELHAKLVGR